MFNCILTNTAFPLDFKNYFLNILFTHCVMRLLTLCKNVIKSFNIEELTDF